MDNDQPPMKASFIFREQFNLRITEALKADIRLLSGHGVDIPELVRPLIEDAIVKAKKKIIDAKAG